MSQALRYSVSPGKHYMRQRRPRPRADAARLTTFWGRGAIRKRAIRCVTAPEEFEIATGIEIEVGIETEFCIDIAPTSWGQHQTTH